MNGNEWEYLTLLRAVLHDGSTKDDRTGTGTRSLFGERMVFDLSDGRFPLLTTKRIHTKSVIHELLWMLSGSTSVRDLQKNGVTIWDEWADENGDLGPVYGKQWRAWDAYSPVRESGSPTAEMLAAHGAPICEHRVIDQLGDVIEQIKTNPNSRRLIVSAWNPADVGRMALPPCHLLYQFYVHDGVLSCSVYQRSADVFLGVPFNVASYALLTALVANTCGLVPGTLVWMGGDVHLYSDHVGQAVEQLVRDPRPEPRLRIARDPGTPIDDYRFEDVIIEGYDPHPAIKARVSV